MLRSKCPIHPSETNGSPYEAKRQQKRQKHLLSKKQTCDCRLAVQGRRNRWKLLTLYPVRTICRKKSGQHFFALMYATDWRGLARAAVSIMLRKSTRAGDGVPPRWRRLVNFTGLCHSGESVAENGNQMVHVFLQNNVQSLFYLPLCEALYLDQFNCTTMCVCAISIERIKDSCIK